MRIEISALGVEAVSRDLLRYADHATDLTPVMQNVADMLHDVERQQFASQGAHGSGGWAELADSTRRRKAALGQDPRILHATGALLESLTGGSGEVSVPRPDGLDFGSTLPYARLHQDGTSRMPARPPVQLAEQDRRKVIREIQRYILEGDR